MEAALAGYDDDAVMIVVAAEAAWQRNDLLRLWLMVLASLSSCFRCSTELKIASSLLLLFTMMTLRLRCKEMRPRRSCGRRRWGAGVALEAKDAVAIDDVVVAAATATIMRHGHRDLSVEDDSRSNRMVLPMKLKEEVVGAMVMVHG